MTCTATLRSDSPRLDLWMEMFGGPSVPIRSLIARPIEVHRDEVLAYMVNLGMFSAEQLDTLVAYYIRTAGPGESPDPEGVRQNLFRYGVPVILGPDLLVCAEPQDLVCAFESVEAEGYRRGQRELREALAREEARPPLAIGTRGARATRGQG